MNISIQDYINLAPFKTPEHNQDPNEAYFSRLGPMTVEDNARELHRRLGLVRQWFNFDDIHNIYDVGSFGLIESVTLSRTFSNATVHAFEPTPDNIARCQNVYDQLPEDLKQRIILNKFAANDKTGSIKFYPLDPEASRSPNFGIASKFKLIDGLNGTFLNEHWVQKEIEVHAFRLDDYCTLFNRSAPDLIWMDVQGAELDVLRGLGDKLSNVKIIITEAGKEAYYHGHGLHQEIDAFLVQNGFKEIVSARRDCHAYEYDVVYVNTAHMKTNTQMEPKKMKWEEDLVKDIRFMDYRDDLDENDGSILECPNYTRQILVRHPVTQVQQTQTPCNIENIKSRLTQLQPCRAILEIGVDCNIDYTEMTSSKTFLEYKQQDTIYIGVDITDKSYLDDPSRNIYTIKTSSYNIDEVMAFARSKGVEEIDFLFIDGLHGINECLIEWEYTRWLSAHGIVGWHDTASHPGPYLFTKYLNPALWNVIPNCCSASTNDYGIGFATRK